jgi:NADPH:quinone reductase
MRAIEISEFGGPEVLRLTERPVPQCGAGEVLVKVAAAGVNRPDATQRRGLYPPPPGTTDIPGLDVAGQVVAVGAGVTSLAPGDYTCALVAGGGYAEYVCVPQAQCLPIPRGMGLVDAASLPEVFFTAWNKVMEVGRLQPGESILVQGGTSGVGMAAIQLARHLRSARVIASAGSPGKCARCIEVGADAAVNYRDADWPQQALAHTGGQGLDVILDAQAGDYIQKEVDVLAVGGRLVLMATHRDVESTVNFRTVVRRRLTIAGSVIRSRTPAQKGLLTAQLLAHVWPLLESGAIATHVQQTFPLEDAVQAHRMLENNEQAGKLVLVADAALVADFSQAVVCAAPPHRPGP